MKKIFLVLFLATSAIYSQQISKNISGIVSDGRSPLENVQIRVEGSDIALFTDAEGRYTLRTAQGST
ncbi:MAG: carboxypeptidase-like regulatory domain-containing protein, partial [Maribacter sp.]|nr:carboxypeptidase-like regulatory domain-containing protein [Maribacter sp.]